MSKYFDGELISGYEKSPITTTAGGIDINTCNITNSNTITELKQRIAELEEENAKLQEQLKNAIVPKFKSRDIAYRIHWFTKEIEQVMIVNTKIEIVVGINIIYTIAIADSYEGMRNLSKEFFENMNSYIDQVKECELFATEAEAQKHLEQQK